MESLVSREVRGAVAVVTLDDPDRRNALSPELVAQLSSALEALDRDAEVRAIVLAGSKRVFAAGADIRAMAERSFQDLLEAPTGALWRALGSCRTPLIAAVSGYALGGGCELALACDMVVAAEGAQFGQPEILLGIIPGAGGTQRLARLGGKQRAMELVLTGRRFDAREARELGVVSVVAGEEDWLDRAVELATLVAERPPLAVRFAKQAVLAAAETPLSEGLEYERRLFELALATEDRVEGMHAFLEKRRPEFRGR